MGFLNNLINGISLGSIYAVIALGYTLVYGLAKMLTSHTATLLWWADMLYSPA